MFVKLVYNVRGGLTAKTVLPLDRLLALLEELAHLLHHTTRDSDTPTARVLQHTAEGVEGTIEGDNVLCDAVHLDDDISGVHLDNTGLETADGARDLRVLQHHRCRELVEA